MIHTLYMAKIVTAGLEENYLTEMDKYLDYFKFCDYIKNDSKKLGVELEKWIQYTVRNMTAEQHRTNMSPHKGLKKFYCL